MKPGDSLSISIRVEAPPQGAKPGKTVPAKKTGVFSRAAAAIRAFFRRPKVSAFFRAAFSPMGLFILGCALFTLTRFIRLPDFPIYFASDEALTALRGLDLIRDGGFDYDKYFLPPFFINDGRYSLGTIVYLQILPLLAFGKSVWVVRGVSAVISIFGVIWFCFILRDIFKLKLWWAGVFLFGVIPAWFLFSRTAYAAAEMTALYTGALYYYLRYRTDKPVFIFPAVILAGMAFCAYQPAELLVALTLLILGLVDIRYHIKNWKVALPAVGVLLVFALLIGNFYRVHFDLYSGTLQAFNSYLNQDLPVIQKVEKFLSYYFTGLSPLYWFSSMAREEPFYQMKGYHYFPLILAPLAVWGAFRLIRRRNRLEILTVAIPFFAAPIAAAMIGIQVTRVIAEILPYALLIMLGMEAAANWLERYRVRAGWITAGVVVLLSIGQVSLLVDSLTRGPLWYSDYGLSGIQWGGNQVFKKALEYSNANPNTKVYISGGWTFKADGLLLFFIPKDAPVFMGSPDIMANNLANGEDLTFVLTPEELKHLRESGDYASIQEKDVIPCPDGNPCFIFATLRQDPELRNELLASEAQKMEPLEEGVVWNGEELDISVTPLSDGKISNLFDGRDDTFIRSANINPLVIDMGFPQVTPLTSIMVRVGSEPITVSVNVNPDDPQKKLVFTQTQSESDGYKEIRVDFGDTQQVKKIQIAVQNMLSPEEGFVHIWELELLAGEEE